MINFDEMVKNKDMAYVILFLVSRSENGMSYPSIARFFGGHKADEKNESYNIKLIHETKRIARKWNFCKLPSGTGRAGAAFLNTMQDRANVAKWRHLTLFDDKS